VYGPSCCGIVSVMDMTLDPLNSGSIKRIRQACANCRYARIVLPPDLRFQLMLYHPSKFRRKKTKCSGERPVCFHCRRNRLTCIYEPYSTTISDPPAPPLAPTASIPTDQSNVSYVHDCLRCDFDANFIIGKASSPA
jgi:hypothetical protein